MEDMPMVVNIDDIDIGKRIRKDLGDLRPLMESLRTYGLMNPVVITKDKALIAGHRRLEAARQLGWKNIEARMMDPDSELEMLELEIEENMHRRSLAADELSDGYDRLNRLKNPGFFRKIWNAIRRFFAFIFRRGKNKKGRRNSSIDPLF
jgi:ParB family transcriptional regulator, chromosome partitioning protein